MGYIDNNGLSKLLNLIKSAPQNLKPASASSLGGVMVGSGLDISSSGVLSVNSENIHPLPQYDFNRGRYTNESITSWLDSYADGLEYGIKWGYSEEGSGPEVIKLGANEGLEIEFSTTTKQGKNDYLFKKLFMCPRVHGGVDPDGMPYVTSIEGLDNRFDPENNNTFVLTPLYYYKLDGVTEDSIDYEVRWYSDTPKTNYYPCDGAYTHLNKLRPYILRACYPVTVGNKWSSVKGKRVSNEVFTVNEAYESSKINTQNLSQLCYQDLCYMVEFMMIMLGTKALNALHLGCSYGGGWWGITQNSDANYVIASDTDEIFVGMRLDIGTSYTTSTNYGNENTWNIAQDLLVTRIEKVNASTSKVYFDELDGTVNITSNYYLNCNLPKTGCLDSVLGTYGSALDINGDIYGYYPYKFQNMEWGYYFDNPVVNLQWNTTGNNYYYPYICYDIPTSQLNDNYEPSTGFFKCVNGIKVTGSNISKGFVDLFFSNQRLPFPETGTSVSLPADNLVGAFKLGYDCSVTTWDIHGPASFQYGRIDPLGYTKLGGRISTVGRSSKSSMITS